MKKISKSIVTLACVGLVGGVAMINPGKANASDKYDYQRNHSRDGGYQKRHGAYKAPRVIHHGPTIIVPDRRVRRFHNT